MSDWKQKIEMQIDRLNNERSVYDAEMCDVAADTMQALLDVAVAAEKVELGYESDTDCPFCAYDGLQDALDKLREAGDD